LFDGVVVAQILLWVFNDSVFWVFPGFFVTFFSSSINISSLLSFHAVFYIFPPLLLCVQELFSLFLVLENRGVGPGRPKLVT